MQNILSGAYLPIAIASPGHRSMSANRSSIRRHPACQAMLIRTYRISRQSFYKEVLAKDHRP